MSSDQIQQGRKIAITGHGFDVTENDIRHIFERFGEISEVVYIRNKETGKSKGFSFVVYNDHVSAQRAINSMHHDFIFDRRVSVEIARHHKLDDSFPSNYSPGLAKPQPYHHPHGMSPNSYRHVRRQQQSEFFPPRPPLEPRYPFPPGYPPLSRSEMNHSPPNRFHSPAQRSDLFPRDKSLEVVQEPESVPHPLATPSSLSGTSEQEDGEIPSGPERKLLEPLEDGEMPDGGTPIQRATDAPEDAFRSVQTDKQNVFSISNLNNLKMDAATEKLLENIIRIQGSLKMDSNEAQRVWAQGGLRKQKEPSPPIELDSKQQKHALDQLSPLVGNPERKEPDMSPHSAAPASRPTSWKHGRIHEQSMPKDLRWEHKGVGPMTSPLTEPHLGNPPPFDGVRMIGHPLQEGRDWAPPAGPRHRPDLRHILGPDKHIVDQNPGNYNYNSYHFQRPLQEPLSRPPYSHTPPSRHVHFPLRHPGPDAPYQGFPQQQALPVHNHPSQQQYMSGPGLHPSPDVMQGAGPMMEPSQGAYQHPPTDSYPYAPMQMQDQSSGSMPGYAMQFPGGGNALPLDHGMGMQEHSIPPQNMGPHHQQPVEIPGQLIGNDGGTNYQISPATIAQANIAQAAVNSDQSQDLSRSKDPMTLMSRMYVGNLDPKQVNKEDLHDTFSVYGRILDIKIHNHFAFIQFDNPFSCMDAIHTAHSNTIQGQPPKLQLAADGQRARNEMISSGNTSSLPPDPKELPPNMPYPNPFRGQSGHLPTFLTVQPTQQQHIESPSIPQPNFPAPATPTPMPANIRQPPGPHQPIHLSQNALPAAALGPQSNQPAVNPLLASGQSQEATNAQINAQLLSTALGLDPSALAAILSSLPMLAKGKEDGVAGTKGTQPVKSTSADANKVGSNKRDRSEKESKKRKKKEMEKQAKTKRLNEMEAKKQKAKKKEEELAKVKARLTRDIASVKDSKSKDKLKRKSDSKHESKSSKHFNSEEVYRKLSQQESSNVRDPSLQRTESKSQGEATSSRDRGEAHAEEKGEKPFPEKKERSSSEKLRHRTKLSHKTRHESKSHKHSHSPSHSKSRKRSRTPESPPSAKESPKTQDDIIDQYAYLYDMMTQNPMNRLMKDYHDYYVGIYGYNFSHWSSEYERFLEDYPMDEDTKEMLELMQSFPGYSYYYGNMSSMPNTQSNTERPEEMPRNAVSPSEEPKRLKSSEENTHQDATQGRSEMPLGPQKN